MPRLGFPPQGFSSPAQISALTLLVNEIEIKLDDPTTGLEALKLLIDAIEEKLDDGTTGLAALKALLDAIEVKLDDFEVILGFAYKVFSKAISDAANAGDVTIATVAANPVVIDSIVLMANTAQTVDMTSCSISGAGKVVIFIDPNTAIQGNLNAADKQVAWTGAVRLAVGKTIVISLVGTGATAVDLTATITYHAEAAGGILS